MFISCLIVYIIDVAITKIFLSKNGLYGGYMNIYLYEDGELIYDDGLIFKTMDKSISIPYQSVNNIFLFKNVLFDTNLIRKLNELDIRLFTFNKNNYYLLTDNLSQGDITVAMTKAYISKKRISIAKSILKSVWHNMITLLHSYHIDTTNTLFSKLKSEIKNKNDINILLLCEAKIRKLYYSYFNEIIKNPDFEFKSRIMNPPTDPINSLISFINSLIYKDTLINILCSNLNASIAFLHSATDRKSSLEYDISEIYKPLIVDRVIFTLINNKIINSDDFIYNTNMCIIKPNSKKKIIEVYERKINSTVTKHNKRIKYKDLILSDCIKLRRYLLNEQRQISFYKE